MRTDSSFTFRSRYHISSLSDQDPKLKGKKIVRPEIPIIYELELLNIYSFSGGKFEQASTAN